MPLGMEVGLGPATLCLRGTQLPTEKKAHPPHPIFGPCLLWSNGWMDQDATWYGGKPWPRQHCVKWGRSSPSPKRRHSPPQFSVHVYCGQMAEWMKMPLGTEVDLGPGHAVLDGVPALHKRGTAALPSFRPMSIVATVCPSQLLLSSCDT